MSDAVSPGAGWTVREVARRYRVSPSKVRAWIKAGRLGAIDTSSTRCRQPRFVILPRHLEEFEQHRSAAPPPKPERRTKRTGFVDYYPDD